MRRDLLVAAKIETHSHLIGLLEKYRRANQPPDRISKSQILSSKETPMRETDILPVMADAGLAHPVCRLTGWKPVCHESGDGLSSTRHPGFSEVERRNFFGIWSLAFGASVFESTS
jgi:hypothetical protein